MAGLVKNITKYRFLINKFLIDVNKFQSKDWAREVKIAKKLLSSEFDFSFWKRISVEKKYFSLSFFLTKEGKGHLFTQKRLLEVEIKNNEDYILLNEKVGEDKKIVTKPQSILDFIKYGKS
jgi:hypothetical protein